jgi:hypothetical protein
MSFEEVLGLILLGAVLAFIAILAHRYIRPRKIVINLENEIEAARQVMLQNPTNDRALVNRMYAELWPDKYLKILTEEETKDEEPEIQPPA